MSAFGGKADMTFCGEREQLIRHLEAERPRGLEIDYQLVFGRTLHRKVGGLLAFKDAIDVASSLPAWIDRVRSVGHEATFSNKKAEWASASVDKLDLARAPTLVEE
jgi:hypothetical protein